MRSGNLKAILLAALGAFMVSSLWYALFGDVLAADSGRAVMSQPSPVATALVELTRNLILSGVLTYLVAGMPVRSVGRALLLSGILWVGFPLILLVGSVFHEGVAWAVAATHGVDWLLKITLIMLILQKYRVGFPTDRSDH